MSILDWIPLLIPFISMWLCVLIELMAIEKELIKIRRILEKRGKS